MFICYLALQCTSTEEESAEGRNHSAVGEGHKFRYPSIGRRETGDHPPERLRFKGQLLQPPRAHNEAYRQSRAHYGKATAERSSKS